MSKRRRIFDRQLPYFSFLGLPTANLAVVLLFARPSGGRPVAPLVFRLPALLFPFERISTLLPPWQRPSYAGQNNAAPPHPPSRRCDLGSDPLGHSPNRTRLSSSTDWLCLSFPPRYVTNRVRAVLHLLCCQSEVCCILPTFFPFLTLPRPKSYRSHSSSLPPSDPLPSFFCLPSPSGARVSFLPSAPACICAGLFRRSDYLLASWRPQANFSTQVNLILAVQASESHPWVP